MRFLNTILDKALIDPTFMFMTQDYHETQRSVKKWIQKTKSLAQQAILQALLSI